MILNFEKIYYLLQTLSFSADCFRDIRIKEDDNFLDNFLKVGSCERDAGNQPCPLEENLFEDLWTKQFHIHFWLQRHVTILIRRSKLNISFLNETLPMKNWRLCSDNWRKLSFKIEKKIIIAFVGLDGDENSNSKSVLKDGLNECSSNRRKVFKKTFQYYLPRMASGFRDVQFLSNHIFDRKSLQGKFYMYFYILNC